ncbi:hypothetical protein K227x_48110 [Rubripirellula lacrimiformis]|uniref:Uncharacterized protein n=1 Tax=Rubripirellula lacrimiformis TaxID=1930273 RepID=A0A517NGZ4_9BACT|nr:hypothetical protein K227x_48110 [Rubripirellula lacrimiformis]
MFIKRGWLDEIWHSRPLGRTTFWPADHNSLPIDSSATVVSDGPVGKPDHPICGIAGADAVTPWVRMTVLAGEND